MEDPGVYRYLPFALTSLRLLLGPLALAGALAHWPRLIFLPILAIGTLSDIFDGVLARRYGVATPALRRYDSITDLIYYVFILMALWRLCHAVVTENVLANPGTLVRVKHCANAYPLPAGINPGELVKILEFDHGCYTVEQGGRTFSVFMTNIVER